MSKSSQQESQILRLIYTQLQKLKAGLTIGETTQAVKDAIETASTLDEIEPKLDAIHSAIAAYGGGLDAGDVQTAIEAASNLNLIESLLQQIEVNTANSGTGGSSTVNLIELPYTASQSSLYQNSPLTQGSYASLTDSASNTGAGTSNGANEWIKADFGRSANIVLVTLGGGTIPGGFGSVAAEINSCTMQISNDNQAWESVDLVKGVVDFNAAWAGGNNLISYPHRFLIGRQCRYFRLWRGGWVGVAEMHFYGW